MFATSQLSSFSLLLHFLCTTQTLFGEKPVISFLEGSIARHGEDTLNAEGHVLSVFQFHQSFIDYCIRLKLANLLYHYLDSYRSVAHLNSFFLLLWNVCRVCLVTESIAKLLMEVQLMLISDNFFSTVQEFCTMLFLGTLSSSCGQLSIAMHFL